MKTCIKALRNEADLLVSSGNEKIRRKIITELRELQCLLDLPEETMQRLLYRVYSLLLTANSSWWSVRVWLIDQFASLWGLNYWIIRLKLQVLWPLKNLQTEQKLVPSFWVAQIVCGTKSSILTIVIGKLLLTLSSLGLVKEAGKNEFTASTMIKNLMVPEIHSGLIFDKHYEVYLTKERKEKCFDHKP